MRGTSHHRSALRWLLLVALVLLAGGTAQRLVAADVTGAWQVSMDFNGNTMTATLTFEKKPDGTLTGKWGASPLSDVKLDGDKLTFTRTMRMGGQEFPQEFTGTVKDGKLTGTMGNDQFEFPITAVPKKPLSPALGQWDITFNVGDRDIAARLIISQQPDGTLVGKWNEEGEHTVSNVKYDNGKLTFTRDSKIEGMELQTTYEGTIKGDELIGTLKGDMGSWQANGKRFGTALIGTWELTSETEMGTFTSNLTINPDLSGSYEFFGGEIPIKNLTLDNGDVTFTMETQFGGEASEWSFKGKLDGKTLKGKMDTPRGTNDIVGKKIEAAPAVASSIVGTWEMTSESPMGTRTNTLKIKDDMTGTYSFRDTETPISDLKVEGDQVSFKVTMTFNDQEFTREFKGKLSGNTLTGEFISDRGNRPVTGKKIE
jgi:hypothetical protein